MKRRAVLSLAVLLAGAVLWACGPFLPNFILGSDESILDGPHGIFTAELSRLGTGDAPPFQALPPPGDDPAAQTVSADAAELQEAFSRLGTPPAERRTILEAQTRFREELETRRATIKDLFWFSRAKEQPAAAAAAGQPLPPGLPREFALYLDGASAYHDGRLDAAALAWNQLLRLPPDQRHFRSTWAAFMIGKALLYRDPARAAASFRLTRDLVAEGFADSLGLAASSLGWEAMAEAGQGRHDRALLLYQRQRETGDPTAFNSLLIASAEALAAGPEALSRVAADPEARALLTAYVVSRAPEDAESWLKALEAAGVKNEANADRIAWAAYLAGDFEQAAAWLDRAQESTPIARWIRARLLLRDGRLDEARELLAGVARDLPQTGMSLDEAFWFASGSGEILAAPQRAAGEEAALRVTQKDFTGALDELLRAGYWTDAAYLAEQVLSADELKTYVDATWPADLAARYEPPQAGDWETMLAGGYTAPPPERLARDLRHLLGRRLAREGRLREAPAYLPAEARPTLESLAAHLAAGRDKHRSATARSSDLFQAACLLRHQGMEVTGTEAAPDWTLVAGEYDLGGYFGDARGVNRIFVQTPEETARVEKNRAVPWKRFHYRYRAADLAWEAAKLLPRGDEKAEILATAGNWIQRRDPEAADRFYKELVRCCRSTDLGREADELRWFPEAYACPAEGDRE
ncbi:MAG TPA: hypothetical protein VH394_00325 [Thermoanaerobaculia bacterium]|nr:hypothetical protein [Thermoanaerobaculia bacterium]